MADLSTMSRQHKHLSSYNTVHVSTLPHTHGAIILFPVGGCFITHPMGGWTIEKSEQHSLK